jgi:hypothetical protein
MLLSATIFSFSGGYASEYSLPHFEAVTGEVTELWQNDSTEMLRLRVAYTGDYSGQYGYFDFATDFNTFTLGHTPSVGDVITGFFDSTLPAPSIYPPQHRAVALVNLDENLPRVIVARFDAGWVSSANQYRLNIGEATEIIFQNGDAFEGETYELIGRKLLVEFTVSHRDIPETIPNPQRVTILYELAVHPIIDIDWDFDFDASVLENDIWQSVSWNGYDLSEEIDWDAYQIIITLNGASRGVENARYTAVDEGIFVPLRAITEALGFSPSWNEAARSITVDGPRGEISLRIGSPDYYLTSPSGFTSTHTLAPPIIHNSLTYVPLAFFREVYGFNNAWHEGGVVLLDNFERME